MSAERMADLERRVLALEERTRKALWEGASPQRRCEDELTLRYGESVDKTVAARILGVTRATVYAMLEDGRIAGACGGRRVNVRSIADYMARPRSTDGAHRRRSERGTKKTAEMPPFERSRVM